LEELKLKASAIACRQDTNRISSEERILEIVWENDWNEEIKRAFWKIGVNMARAEDVEWAELVGRYESLEKNRKDKKVTSDLFRF
jgi:hypothetical protein